MPRQRSRERTRRGGGLGVFGLPLAAIGGWLAYSHLYANHDVPLEPAIHADRTMFSTERTGRMHVYHRRGQGGRPLVLLHGIHAASSPYQVRPLFDAYAMDRPVWAPDLPGFGFSSRKARRYTPGVYANAILDLLEYMVKEPADVVALSLTSEFAAMAALERPDAFHSLTFISPTGMGERSDITAQLSPQEREDLTGLAARVLHAPLVSRPVYDLITLRPCLGWFLRKSLVGPLDSQMVDYAYATSHRPGAHHAPLAFLSGRLFTPEVRQSVYSQLDVPAHVVYDRDPYTGFENLLEFVEEHPNWQVSRLSPSAGLPQIDALADTMRALNRFWASLEG